VRRSVIALLTDWAAPDAAQEALRHAVLAFLHARTDACVRECVPGHVTASTLVRDHTGGRVLLTLHPRLGRWVQLGGHCEDTDADIVAAALREATEESGVADLRIDPNLVAVHVHPVTCSLGVPTRHLDLQFVAHAPSQARIAVSDESVDLRWWPIDALPDGSDDALAYLVARASSSHPMRGSAFIGPDNIDETRGCDTGYETPRPGIMP
jgi:8-oxo-dGTP pyrophosphatase MutT (NUDIX family)